MQTSKEKRICIKSVGFKKQCQRLVIWSSLFCTFTYVCGDQKTVFITKLLRMFSKQNCLLLKIILYFWRPFQPVKQLPVIISCPKDKRKICLILKCFNWIWENYFWRKFVEVIICSERLNAQEALPNSKTPFTTFRILTF